MTLQHNIYFLILYLLTGYANAAIKGTQLSGNGRFYGRIIDSKSGKGIEAASVQIWQDGYDENTHEAKPILKGGMLTEPNGDFSIDNLPVQGYMKLKVKALGYSDFEQRISFDVKFDKKSGPEIDMGTFDKDLGNIKLTPVVSELTEVTVRADEPFVKTSVDRKTYNIDKLMIATGGTATEALKNIPGVRVDMNGNVTIRNASPIIYVDGRPTNLTLDQIPAHTIQSIEVISNPGAKFEARGSGGGIINIILKKDKRLGYNINVMQIIDRRGRIMSSAGFNIREKKLNIFGNASIFMPKSISKGYNNRNIYYSSPIDSIYQKTENIFTNRFINLSGGFDFLINNRNTLTISGNVNTGLFRTFDQQDIYYDSLTYLNTYSLSLRNTSSSRKFENLGMSLQYKKLFTENGKELTADVYYNRAHADFTSGGETNFYNANKVQFRSPLKQRQDGGGDVVFLISQLDYTDPIGKKMKIEMGARTQYNTFISKNAGKIYVDSISDYVNIPSQVNNYVYSEQIHGIYSTFSAEYKKISYQAGIRAEKYLYEGELLNQGKKYSNDYPLSLFPSLFVTYKFNDDHDLRFNASRRVERPTFFQQIPYIDFSDSLTLSKGNPSLKPEFVYVGELSYNYVWGYHESFMANIYYRYSDKLISRVQTLEYVSDLGKYMPVLTFQNANSAESYGIELNFQNKFKKKTEYNLSANLYRSSINSSNLGIPERRNQNSFFANGIVLYKYTKYLIFQFSADFQSRVSLQPVGEGGGGWFFGMGSASSGQGYIRASGGLDLGIRYDFILRKKSERTKKKPSVLPGSFFLNFTDILHTRRNSIYTYSAGLFEQNTFSQRDWQMVRGGVSYRIGEFDKSLFRRKNQNRGQSPQVF